MRSTALLLSCILWACSLAYSQDEPFDGPTLAARKVSSLRQYKLTPEEAQARTLTRDRCLKYQWLFDTLGNVQQKIFFSCDSTKEQEYIYHLRRGQKLAEQWFAYESNGDTTAGKLTAMQYNEQGELIAEIHRNSDFSEAARNDYEYFRDNDQLTQITKKCGICPKYRVYYYKYGKNGEIKAQFVNDVNGGTMASGMYKYNEQDQLSELRVETREGLHETIIDPDESLVRYSYNEDGKLKEKMEFHLKSMEFRRKTHYEYNSKGLLSKQKVFTEPEVVRYIISYEYDYFPADDTSAQ